MASPIPISVQTRLNSDVHILLSPLYNIHSSVQKSVHVGKRCGKFVVRFEMSTSAARITYGECLSGGNAFKFNDIDRYPNVNKNEFESVAPDI